MKSPNLNREQLNDLKELLTERMVDNMSTKDLAEYVADDLFNYFDKLGEHEFLDEAKNYWDDMYDEVVQELIEDTTPWNSMYQTSSSTLTLICQIIIVCHMMTNNL